MCACIGSAQHIALPLQNHCKLPRPPHTPGPTAACTQNRSGRPTLTFLPPCRPGPCRKLRAGNANGLAEPPDRLICALVEGMGRLALFQELHRALQARQQAVGGGGSAGTAQSGAGAQAPGMAITVSSRGVCGNHGELT